MKITTAKNYIASVNFHGASFSQPEWIFSASGDGDDLDLYSGAVVVTGNKGDRSSQEWFVVAGIDLIPVADQEAACDAFHHAASARIAGNHSIVDPLFSGAAKVDAYVSSHIKGYLA